MCQGFSVLVSKATPPIISVHAIILLHIGDNILKTLRELLQLLLITTKMYQNIFPLSPFTLLTSSFILNWWLLLWKLWEQMLKFVWKHHFSEQLKKVKHLQKRHRLEKPEVQPQEHSFINFQSLHYYWNALPPSGWHSYSFQLWFEWTL